MAKLVIDLPKNLVSELEKRTNNSSLSKSWHVAQALKVYLEDDFDIRDTLEGHWKNV